MFTLKLYNSHQRQVLNYKDCQTSIKIIIIYYSQITMSSVTNTSEGEVRGDARPPLMARWKAHSQFSICVN